jgi:hypothetical protein
MVNTGFPARSGPRPWRAGFAALLLLAGCAKAGGGWSKPGADAAATAQAYRDCEVAAQRAVGPQTTIDQDITASRGADWQRADVFHEETGMMRDATADRTRAIVEGCMTAKGFAPGG